MVMQTLIKNAMTSTTLPSSKL